MQLEKHSGPDRQTVLIVDDTAENLVVLGEILKQRYRVKVANSGERALRAAGREPYPDLILLDVMMPDMDGYDVIERLKDSPHTSTIPVIFVTAMDSDEDEEHGLALGAVDYVTKPIRPPILLARVEAHLELKRTRDWLQNQNHWLEQEISSRMAENELIKDISINALASLAETRDLETGNHLYRTQSYLVILMEELREHPRFAPHLSPEHINLIAKAAPLHDIGKVGIPDAILCKPGRLTHEEFEIMKTHSQIGGDAIKRAIDKVFSALPNARKSAPANRQAIAFLEVAHQIALYHHEKWSGGGYPAGLVGDEIPTSARLMSLADTFDALICRRHYKDPFPLERTISIIRDERGRQFDPDVVDAFLACTERFAAIAREYSDEK